MNQVLKMFVLAILISACSSSEEPPEGYVQAYITGIDARRCVCCGGAMITLSDNTIAYEEPYYQWYNYSDNIDLPFNSTFPKDIFVQYEEDITQCSSSLGIIEVKSLIIN